MPESIKRDEHIRLKNGKQMLLDASKLENGKYEVMLLNPRTGAEVDSATVKTEEEALAEFERLRKKYNAPALVYGLERKGDDDGGTSNFDAPSLHLPGWTRKKVEAAAEYAGLGCFTWNLWGSKSYVFSIRQGVGQGYTRSRAAEAMREYLSGLGYDASTYCQAD